MTDPSTQSAAQTPAAAQMPAAAQPARPRTRRPDAWTTLFLAATATLGTWSLALVAATLLALIAPAYEADDDAFDLKTLGAVTVAVIAVGQAFTMGAAMGRIPKVGLPMRVLMRTHRRVGRIGLALAGVVAFLCWRAAGGGAPTADGIVHGALASTGFLSIAAKLALLKWRPGLAFRVAPWLGVYAATAFILVALSAMLGDDLLDLGEWFEPGEDGGDGGKNDGGDDD